MQLMGRVFQLSISGGGVPKHRIPSGEVGPAGLAGDSQRDLRAHGGPDRALCIYAVEQLALLRMQGHRLAAGSLGENVTTEGIDWSEVTPGVRLRFGPDVLVEVTEYAAPCWKNARWFTDRNFNRISQETHPGSSRVYARILCRGTISEGDPVVLLGSDAIDRVRRHQPVAVRWPRDFA